MHEKNTKNSTYKRFQPSRLRFPKHLVFRSSGDSNLVCNKKKVKVVASQAIHPNNYPPINIEIDAVGLFSFTPSNVDYYILSFLNKTNLKTECAVVPASVFSNYVTHPNSKGEIKLKLFLSSRGLYEFQDADGAEFYFMGLWLTENRNFTQYYNNWLFFE